MMKLKKISKKLQRRQRVRELKGQKEKKVECVDGAEAIQNNSKCAPTASPLLHGIQLKGPKDITGVA